MQKNHLLFKKGFRLLFALVISTLFMMTISSCGKGGKKSKNPTCVKLTKAQVQKWVKKGYTDPASKDYITAVRFTTAYAGPGAVFKVYVIGQRKDYTLIEESLTELSPVDTCDKSHIKLSDFIFTGTIPAEIADLKILNNGKVIDSLNYLRLEPFDYRDPKTYYDYLAYNVNIVWVSGNVTVPSKEVGKDGVGLPCPPCPNCPPAACPKPPTCETCGPSATDTIPVLP